MIKLVRLDYRLLHGQVCFTWVQHCDAQRIIVVDDASASNDLKKSALKLAKPQGVRLNVFTCEMAIKKMPKVEQLDENIIMIFGSTRELACFCMAWPKVREINYGATANKEGAHQYGDSIFLDANEREDTQRLLDRGVFVYIQQTPLMSRKRLVSV